MGSWSLGERVFANPIFILFFSLWIFAFLFDFSLFEKMIIPL